MSSQQRIDVMWNIIKKHNRIKRIGIQNNTKWGDGVMNSIHRAFMSEYKEEVSWNPREQEYIMLDAIQERLI